MTGTAVTQYKWQHRMRRKKVEWNSNADGSERKMAGISLSAAHLRIHSSRIHPT